MTEKGMDSSREKTEKMSLSTEVPFQWEQFSGKETWLNSLSKKQIEDPRQKESKNCNPQYQELPTIHWGYGFF